MAIKFCIFFRLHLLLTYKAIQNLTQPYEPALLNAATPSRPLRSSASLHQTVPSARLTTEGIRAFSRSAPRLWNFLPSNLRNIDSPLQILPENSPVTTSALLVLFYFFYVFVCSVLSLFWRPLISLVINVMKILLLYCVIGCQTGPFKWNLLNIVLSQP